MKLRARVAAVAALLLFSLTFYRCWVGLKIRYRKAIGELPKRLIIFGDESSAILSSPEHLRFWRSESPSTWAEHLCATLYADCQSFAPTELPRGDQGPVLDNNICNNTSVPAADLKTQVEEWIQYEQQHGNVTGKQSFFAISFGVNDIWRYSAFSKKEAQGYVETSLETLFQQLRIMTEYLSPVPMNVLLHTVVDVTLLPAWKTERSLTDKTGMELRNAVYLARLWNEGLAKRARHFGGADIRIWEAHEWFLDTMRNGKKAGWDVVTDGCVDREKICKNPHKFLMWDGFHFGSRAHQLMAEQMFKHLL